MTEKLRPVQISMATTAAAEGDSTTETNVEGKMSKKQVLKNVSEWWDCHGTHFNDFDEIHIRFLDQDSEDRQPAKRDPEDIEVEIKPEDGEREDSAEDLSRKLQETVRACNSTVRVLRAAQDMIQDPDRRQTALAILDSQIPWLEDRVRANLPEIATIAKEYLLPAYGIPLEFGMHDDENAYLNYEVPPGQTLSEPRYMEIVGAMCKAAEDIANTMNDLANVSGTGKWVAYSEPNLFDRVSGNELGLDDPESLAATGTVQIMLVLETE